MSTGLLPFLITTLLLANVAIGQQSTATLPNTAIVPRLIRFGGVLKDSGGQPLSGKVGITFALYKEQEGGAPLWLETQNVPVEASGHYSALLGATKEEGVPMELFISGDARWLGVQVEDRKEQPRVLLISVPYALKAMDAETVGGKPASAFMLAPKEQTSAASEPVLKATPGVSTASITGTGTAGHVVRWTGATSQGDSLIIQSSSSNIGVGTGTPAAKLTVSSGGGFSSPQFQATQKNTADFSRLRLNVAGSPAWDIATGGGSNNVLNFFSGATNSNVLSLTNAGSVGIGTLTPQAVLNLNRGGTANQDTLLIGNNTTKGLQLFDSGTAVDIGSIGVPLFINAAGQNTYLNAFGTGRVGVGTPTPEASLNIDVGGTADKDTFLIGHSKNRGLQLRDTGSGVDIESIGVPLYINFATGQDVHLNTNAEQIPSASGWVKVLMYFDPERLATNQNPIIRCYNSQLAGAAATTPPCGFKFTNAGVDRFVLDFGFNVSNRFISFAGIDAIPSSFNTDDPPLVTICPPTSTNGECHLPSTFPALTANQILVHEVGVVSGENVGDPFEVVIF